MNCNDCGAQVGILTNVNGYCRSCHIKMTGLQARIRATVPDFAFTDADVLRARAVCAPAPYGMDRHSAKRGNIVVGVKAIWDYLHCLLLLGEQTITAHYTPCGFRVGEGADWPLTSYASCIEEANGVVNESRVTSGGVLSCSMQNRAYPGALVSEIPSRN